jgi:hypothetical protein
MSLAFVRLLPVTQAEKNKTLPALLLTKQRSYTEHFLNFNYYGINQNKLPLSGFKTVR